MKIYSGSINPVKTESIELIMSKTIPNQYTIIEVDLALKTNKAFTEAQASARANMRAKNAFSGKIGEDIAIGLESYTVQEQYDGNYLNICICSLFDGEKFYRAPSSGFYILENLAEQLSKGTSLSEAVKLEKLTDLEGKIGENEGLIGILTKEAFGRENMTTRAQYMSEAVRNAFMHYQFAKKHPIYDKQIDQAGNNIREIEEQKKNSKK